MNPKWWSHLRKRHPVKPAQSVNLLDVSRELGTEQECFAFLERMRWPEGCERRNVSSPSTSASSAVTCRLRVNWNTPSAQPAHRFSM